MVVEAAAGSGKTAVLSQRFMELLKENPAWLPRDILVLTFTKKAVSELRARIIKNIDDLQTFVGVPEFSIMTIHGLCQQILKNYPLEAGMCPGFKLIDEDEWMFHVKQYLPSFIKRLFKKQGSEMRVLLAFYGYERLIDFFLSLSKLAFFETLKPLDPDRIEEESAPLKKEYLEALQIVFPLFCQFLTSLKERYQVLLYDDLLVRVNQLLMSPYVMAVYQQRYRYIMVDESQDTDPMQWEILSKFCSGSLLGSRKVFLVGDLRQAIYGFRGASSDLFATFMSKVESLGEGALIKMADNFRSSPSIVSFVNEVFSGQIEGYTPIKSGVQFCEGDACVIQRVNAESELQESLLQSIMTSLEILRCQFSDIVILCRSHGRLKYWRSFLESRGFACQEAVSRVPGGDEYCLDLLSLLVLAIRPFDSYALTRVLMIQGLFDFSADEFCRVGELMRMPTLSTISFFEALLSESFFHVKHRAIEFFLERFLNFQRDLQVSSLSKGFSRFVKALGLTCIESFQYQSFMDALIKLESSGLSTSDILLRLKDQVSVGFGLGEEVFLSDRIVLMTQHAVKGLEFPVVIIPDLQRPLSMGRSMDFEISEGELIPVLPSSKKMSFFLADQCKAQRRLKAIHEEIRLLYVAMTRAQRRLYLLGSGGRKVKCGWDIVLRCLLVAEDDKAACGKTQVESERSLINEKFCFRESVLGIKGLLVKEVLDESGIGGYPMKSFEEGVLEPRLKKSSFFYDGAIKKVEGWCPIDFLQSRFARERGVVLHQVLAFINRDPDMSLASVMRRCLGIRSCDDALYEMCRGVIRRYRQSWVFKSRKLARSVFVEREFRVFLDGAFVHVRLDLLLLLKDGSALVVDFKMGERDESQLLVYRRVVSKYLSMPEDLIQVKFYVF